MNHDDLVIIAQKWLNKQGCGVSFTDKIIAATNSGERPDAIGWRDGLSIVVECKISRSDFLSDKRKSFRKDSSKGMGDWRFYICPPDVIKIDDLPNGWGLLYCDTKRVVNIFGVPPNTRWWKDKPFDGNKLCEMQIMYSAIRKMSKLNAI